MSAYVHALRLLCLCVRVEHYGVWGELVNPLTHCPSSQGWAPKSFPCLFVFYGCGVLVLVVCWFWWCVGSGFPSILLFLYNYDSGLADVWSI